MVDYYPRIRQQQEGREMAQRAGHAMWTTIAGVLLAFMIATII